MKNVLKEFIEKHKDKKIAITSHVSPLIDPDGMASCLALKEYFKVFKIESKVYYNGELSHPQNKTIVNVLNMEMEKEEIPDDSILVIVDATETNVVCKIKPSLVIDHHKNNSKAEFQIIESKYGACSTIIWELVKDDIVKENSDVFTALLLGIRTDTNDLISENMIENDFIAYQELLSLSDKEKLQKVMNYPLPRYIYDARLELRKDGNFYEGDGVFIGGIGNIPSSQRDVISLLAEENNRMESIQTSIIFAITDKKDLEVSVRSTNVSLDVGSMCKELFNGGGNSYKGGAKIPLTFWNDLENGEKFKFWELTCKHMFRKVMKENLKEEK